MNGSGRNPSPALSVAKMLAKPPQPPKGVQSCSVERVENGYIVTVSLVDLAGNWAERKLVYPEAHVAANAITQLLKGNDEK